MKTYWKTWRERQGDGWSGGGVSFYKQLWDAEKDEPIGKPIKIDYSEYENL